MLDDSSDAHNILCELSAKITELMHYDGEDFLAYFISLYGEPLKVVSDTLRDIQNPYREMITISKLINKVIEQIESELID